MPSNAEEYVKSWMTHLKADKDAARCPMFAENDLLLHHEFSHHQHIHPLSEMFKLPVPWKKKDDVTPHIQKYDKTMCLERESQDVKKECPYSCLCKKVIDDDDDDDNEPPFPGSKPGHCPKAEIKDLCSCKQVLIKEPDDCPPEQLQKPVLLSPIDHSACTCPRVPLPLVKPEPKLQKPVQCECVERSMQQAPTFFKCMQEKRQVNIAQLFSQMDEPNEVKQKPRAYTVAATQVEFEQPMDEILKESQPIIPSTKEFSEKSKKSKTSGKNSSISQLTKTRKTKSDYTVSTAPLTSAKESSCKEICPNCKQDTTMKLISEDSTSSIVRRQPVGKKPVNKRKLSEPEMIKMNKSCSTVNRNLKRKQYASMGKQISSDENSKQSKFRRPDISYSSLTSRNSKTTKSGNTYHTYMMKGPTISSSSDETSMKLRPKYVDVDDINKVKKKTFDPEAECGFRFDNPENMKQIKEIMEREAQDCKTRLKLAYVDGMYPGFHAGHKTCCLPYMFVPKNMSWLYNTCEGAGKIKPDLGWRPGSIRADVASIMSLIKKGKSPPEFSHPPGGGIRKPEEGKKKEEKKEEEKSEELDGEGFACLAEIDIYKKGNFDEKEELVQVIEGEGEEEKPRDMKPTLHMHKTHGQYFVTLHPAGKSKEVLKAGQQDSVLLTFDRKALDTGADTDGNDDDTTTVTTDSLEMDFTSALGMYRRRDPIPRQTVQTNTHKIQKMIQQAQQKQQKK